MMKQINFDEAVKLMQDTDKAEVFTDRGWGDNGEEMIVTIIQDGDGQKPLAEVSIGTFKKLQEAGRLGPNVLRTFKARCLYEFTG